MTEFLDIEDLLSLVEDLEIGPVRDVGLLESAAARPRTVLYGEDAYPGLADKAGALLHSICNNHALVDGNKRLAWLATVVFLDLNGFVVDLVDDEAFDLVMRVASSDVEASDVARSLEASIIPR